MRARAQLGLTKQKEPISRTAAVNIKKTCPLVIGSETSKSCATNVHAGLKKNKKNLMFHVFIMD